MAGTNLFKKLNEEKLFRLMLGYCHFSSRLMNDGDDNLQSVMLDDNVTATGLLAERRRSVVGPSGGDAGTLQGWPPIAPGDDSAHGRRRWMTGRSRRDARARLRPSHDTWDRV